MIKRLILLSINKNKSNLIKSVTSLIKYITFVIPNLQKNKIKELKTF